MNNYFDDFEREDRQKKARAIPAWAWAVAIIGLVISIIWGYSGGTSFALLLNMGTIEDTTPDSFELGTLDFTDPLYISDETDMMLGYNFIDYPAFATYYDSDRGLNENGGYDNVFDGDAEFSVEFYNLNYYDVPCVFSTKMGQSRKLTIMFESTVSSGNLEARILVVDKDYQTEQTEDGYTKIKAEYIQSAFEFKANEKDIKTATYNGDAYVILVVAGESAVGSFDFKISVGE